MRKNSFSSWFLVLLGILLLAGLLCDQAEAAKPGSATFTSSQDGFSVVVPQEFKNFKYSVEPLDTAMGKKEIHIYKSTKTTMGFSIMITDYGMKNVKEADAQKLREMRIAAIEKRGKVLSKGKGVLAGKPALVLFDMIDAKGQKVFSETWVAFIDGKMFQLSYLTTSSKQITNPLASRFFSSFKYPVK